MPVVNYHHTLEALKIIKSDIKRIAKIVSITIQILFILYYAYLIATNVEQPHYLIAYSCLLGVSLLIFVLSIILYSKRNINRKIEYKNKKILSDVGASDVFAENMKKLGSKVRRKLLSYLETSKVYELANVDEMSPELRNLLLSGKDVLNALIQPKFSPRTEEEMLDKFSKLIEASEKAEEENKEDQKRDKKEDSNDQDNNSNTNGNVEESKETTVEPQEVVPETPVNSETNNDLELPEAEEDVETNG